jgi:hypothetical protein
MAEKKEFKIDINKDEAADGLEDREDGNGGGGEISKDDEIAVRISEEKAKEQPGKAAALLEKIKNTKRPTGTEIVDGLKKTKEAAVKTAGNIKEKSGQSKEEFCSYIETKCVELEIEPATATEIIGLAGRFWLNPPLFYKKLLGKRIPDATKLALAIANDKLLPNGINIDQKDILAAYEMAKKINENKTVKKYVKPVAQGIVGRALSRFLPGKKKK